MFRFRFAVLALLCMPALAFAEDSKKPMSVHYGRGEGEAKVAPDKVKSWKGNLELYQQKGNTKQWLGAYQATGSDTKQAVSAVNLRGNDWLLFIEEADGKKRTVGGHMKKFGDQVEFVEDKKVKE